MINPEKPLVISNPIVRFTLDLSNPLYRMRRAEQAMIRELEAGEAIRGTDEEGNYRWVTWVGVNFSIDGVPQNDENDSVIRAILDDCLRRSAKSKRSFN